VLAAPGALCWLLLQLKVIATRSAQLLCSYSITACISISSSIVRAV
jgi:hypothetical protein